MKIGGKYRIYETLGKGAFGVTHKVTNFRDPFALKEIELKPSVDSSAVNAELESHENIPRHENLITFIDHFTENNKIYLVLDYCEPGNLNDFAVSEKMDEVSIVRTLKDISHGLAHLHKHGVVHGNIKPQNIVLEMSHGHKPVFKISDFNTPKTCCPKDWIVEALSPGRPVCDYVEGKCGLVLFWPPEYKQTQFSDAGDVFSVGAVVFVLFQMRTEKKVLCPLVKPSGGMESPIALSTAADIEIAVKATVAESIRPRILSMLSLSPAERPTFYDVLEQLE